MQWVAYHPVDIGFNNPEIFVNALSPLIYRANTGVTELDKLLLFRPNLCLFSEELLGAAPSCSKEQFL